jgi:hypothetical protein
LTLFHILSEVADFIRGKGRVTKWEMIYVGLFSVSRNAVDNIVYKNII